MPSPFQLLQRHIKRWQNNIPAATLLTKEASQRLIERLEYIKLQPQIILDCSHMFMQQARSLHERFPAASILTINMNPAILSKSTWWSGWLWQDKALIADTSLLPLPDESVDLIFSNHLLFLSPQPFNIIKEWSRVLKPGGLLLFSTLGPDTLKEWQLSQRQLDNQTSPYPFMDMHDIGDSLLQHGFADPVMDMEMLTLNYKNIKNLIQDVRINYLPQMHIASSIYKGRAYWQNFEKVYQGYQTAAGYIPVTCELIFGHAWKVKPIAKNTAKNFTISVETIKRKT